MDKEALDGAPLEDVDGVPIEDVDGVPIETEDKETSELDGRPLESDFDGVPIGYQQDEDLDDAPCK